MHSHIHPYATQVLSPMLQVLIHTNPQVNKRHTPWAPATFTVTCCEPAAAVSDKVQVMEVEVTAVTLHEVVPTSTVTLLALLGNRVPAGCGCLAVCSHDECA